MRLAPAFGASALAVDLLRYTFSLLVPTASDDIVSVSEMLSAVAIVVALGSLMVSLRALLRDRERLKVRSQYFEASEYTHEHVSLWVRNTGRRPIRLRLIKCYDNGGTVFGDDFMLREKSQHDDSLDIEDVAFDFFEGRARLVDAWYQDGVNVRYRAWRTSSKITKLTGKA